MVSVDDIQDKISTKIIEDLGSTVTRKPFSSQTTNKWGDASRTYGSDETLKMVPWNYIRDEENYEPFGDLQAGEVAVAVKETQSINEKDLVVYNGDTFVVKEIEEFPLQDQFLLKVLRLAKDY